MSRNNNVSVRCLGVAVLLVASAANSTPLYSGAQVSVGFSGSRGSIDDVSYSDGDIIDGPAAASVAYGPHVGRDVLNTPATGEATASADLRTGKIRTSGSITQASQSSDMFTYATGMLMDVLTFSMPDNQAAATIPFSLQVEGITYGVVGSYCQFEVTGPNGRSLGSQPYCAIAGPEILSFEVIVLRDVPYQFRARIDQAAYSRSPAGFDFLNTAAVTMELPDGVTYTSLSGQFLVGPPAQIPEPHILALLGLGLAGLGLSRRRKPN